MVPGTGVTLNNFMRWTDLDPANPTAAKPGDPASNGDISCMSPLMIFDSDAQGGGLRWLLGTPGRSLSLCLALCLSLSDCVCGSFGIPQTTTQLIMNVIDFGFDMQVSLSLSLSLCFLCFSVSVSPPLPPLCLSLPPLPLCLALCLSH